MEEKKFVELKKDEFKVKEFIKKELGKGKISSIKIEYTPIGEKIIISTNKPGYIIGRKGERITELTTILKKRFNLENPHLEIMEIEKPEFDAQNIADEIALSLERFGSSKFKVIAYKTMERIIKAGALGVELRLSGKLPSDRAKSQRFAYGYLKKTGNTSKIVNRAQARAETLKGTVGIKVSILPSNVEIHDKIELPQDTKAIIEENARIIQEKNKQGEIKKEKKEKTKKIKKEKEKI
ncbi:MAG: 30S ribosomal protein S3 [Nanoarchaeota archaeon]|nr:30S ribosomal protein S3 [Nanoarchaeota archaeon]